MYCKRKSVVNAFEKSSLLVFKWFINNFMKANSDKSHLLVSFNEPYAAVIDGASSESNIKEVFLEITIERELKFHDHVSTICKKSYQKLHKS